MLCLRNSKLFAGLRVVRVRLIAAIVMSTGQSVLTGISAIVARQQRSAVMARRGGVIVSTLYYVMMGFVSTARLVCSGLLETACHSMRSIISCLKIRVVRMRWPISFAPVLHVIERRPRDMIQRVTRGGSNLYGLASSDRHSIFVCTISNFGGGVF